MGERSFFFLPVEVDGEKVLAEGIDGLIYPSVDFRLPASPII